MVKVKNLATILLLTITLLVTGFSIDTITAKSNRTEAKDIKCSNAGSLATATVSKATYGPQKNIFMWEVTSNKNKGKKVYVLGSVHVANKSVYPLDKRIETAFSNSKNLTVEVDTTKLDQKALQSYLLKYGINPPDKTLKSILPAETYKKLGDMYKEYGIDVNQCDMLQPWTVNLDASSNLASKAGYSGESGIDVYFLNKAKKAKKTIYELESADLQFKMLSSFSEALQVKLLKETLDTTPEAYKSQIDSLFGYWKSGDAAGLEKAMFVDGSDKLLKEYYDKLFYKRNIGMANKIDGYFKDKDTYLVIAGAGHMVGKKGVIELLKAKGYAIKQQ